MVANGDAAKPIWLTEMNSNTVPEGLPTNFGRVTEAQQARYAVEALERVQREWPWVGMVDVWFFKRPTDLSGTNRGTTFASSSRISRRCRSTPR